MQRSTSSDVIDSSRPFLYSQAMAITRACHTAFKREHFSSASVISILDSTYVNHWPTHWPTQTATSPTHTRLTLHQQRALEHVRVRAQLAHTFAREQLDKRALSLGFSARDVTRACEFIRDACPVLIHVKPDVLLSLNKDSQYRSQHETSTSGGALDLAYRDRKEELMFGGAYLSASPNEKPKYGALNPFLDALGVNSAVPRFGDCFLVLKREVKLRCSMGGKGSKGGNLNLGTLDHYRHCLMDYDLADFTKLLEVARTWGQSGLSTLCPPPLSYRHSFQGSYKEVQIHGDILLGQDVEALVLHPSHISNRWIQEAATIFEITFNVRVDRFGASRWQEL